MTQYTESFITKGPKNKWNMGRDLEVNKEPRKGDVKKLETDWY